MDNTCFVIMPIGTQTIGNVTITEDELRKKYDYVIKNAVLKANPNLIVTRADDALNPGSISNDIFTKLMHSQYVIADITYPNPNVFYELGIRHAINTRTILIRENTTLSIPFDISHLRHIEYTQEIDGMDKLAKQLKHQFDFYDANPNKPDNQFLELCTFTNYIPQVYEKRNTKDDVENFIDVFMTLIKNPEVFDIVLKNAKLDDMQSKLFEVIIKNNPEELKKFIKSSIDSGSIGLE